MANDGAIQQMLNNMLQKNLPAINAAIAGAIQSKGLDPMSYVTGGNDSLGSIDLGICTATAGANYSITNLTGLHGFSLDSIQITSAQSGPDNGVSGDLEVSASVGPNLNANLSGHAYAGCGFIKVHPGIDGSATISGFTASAGGTFNANTNNGELTLTSAAITHMSCNYGDLSVNPSGLGILDPLLGALATAIANCFNGDVKNDIASAVTPALNSAIKGILPISESL